VAAPLSPNRWVRLMKDLYLIVGLGNPGREYAETRHNIGFLLLEHLASSWGAPWKMEKKFQSLLARLEQDERKILLCRPQSFMNSSGQAVAALTQFYQLPLERVLVAVDDADLPLGQLRLRPCGSSGGHHGLESIERQLGTRDYPRLRLGIGRRAEDGRQITDYVLGRFLAEERKTVSEILERAGEQAQCWLNAGIQEAMNRFNGAVTAQNKGKE
jgi:PTH1 family peptidyl-tRNA hydrolase